MSDENAVINATAYNLTCTMLKDASFLNFRPSQNAAACLLLAINIACDPKLA